MASAKERQELKKQQEFERARREKERKEYQEAQELESLKRVFKRLDSENKARITADNLLYELNFLGHKVGKKEAALMIWEVDDDADDVVVWEEFETMFHRVRNDRTGYEPRKLFNVVEFLMHDKNHNGMIDMDECMSILYRRFGKDAVEEKTQEMFVADVNNDNNISFSEFLEIQKKAAKTSNTREKYERIPKLTM